MENEWLRSDRHRERRKALDIRSKLMLLLATALLGMMLTHWQALAVLYALTLLLALLSVHSLKKLNMLALLTFLAVWGTMWTQSVFYDAYPQTPIWYMLPPGLVSPELPLFGGLWDGVAVYYEGMLHGLVQSLRMIAPLTMGLLIFWTEDPIRMLGGLRRLKLPYVISFMVMTCLRFIPITFAEAAVTLNAQRLRKYKPFTAFGVFTGYGLYRTIKLTLVPLLANAVRKSANMARSAEARGFRAYETRTEVQQLRMKPLDYAVCVLCAAAVLGLAGCKVLLYLSEVGVYDSEHLLPLYWVTRQYL